LAEKGFEEEKGKKDLKDLLVLHLK